MSALTPLPPLQGVPSTAPGLPDTVQAGAGGAPGSAGPAQAVADVLAAAPTWAASTVKLTQQALLHVLEQRLLEAPEGTDAAMPWPAQGSSEPEQAFAAQLLRTLPAPVPTFNLVALQHWPPALLRQFLRQAAGPGQAPAPALQTAAMQHAELHTPNGVQGVQLTLLVPSEHLENMAPAAQPAAALPTPVFRLADKAWLGTGVMAMVLQHGEEPPISALLMLELGPVRETLVYGRDALLRPVDPWLQQAQYLANAQSRQPREPRGSWCIVDTCPYAGRAACPQPFCTTLAAVARPAV